MTSRRPRTTERLEKLFELYTRLREGRGTGEERKAEASSLQGAVHSLSLCTVSPSESFAEIHCLYF